MRICETITETFVEFYNRDLNSRKRTLWVTLDAEFRLFDDDDELMMMT